MGTSSKLTFCATVIITCCSLAFGPSETSQTLLPGFFAARFAASYSALAAHGSSTAGSTISFLIPGPLGPVVGSSVCSGSGTIPAQTTMWNAFAIVSIPQGLKPLVVYCCSARPKSCPDQSELVASS